MSARTGAVCSVSGCPTQVKARGWCAKHLTRWVRKGTLAEPEAMSPLTRLMGRIDARSVTLDSPCWNFTGPLTDAGYGRVKVAGVKTLTHRLAWESLVGPIPEGLQIDHLCRNRACCNPAHLEPVTPRTNQRRGAGPSGINSRKTHCHRGHELNEANVYLRPDGGRHCKICRRMEQATHRARKRRTQ